MFLWLSKEMLYPLSLFGNSHLRKAQRNPAESNLTLFKLVYFIMKPFFTGHQEVTSYKTTFPGEHVLEKLI